MVMIDIKSERVGAGVGAEVEVLFHEDGEVVRLWIKEGAGEPSSGVISSRSPLALSGYSPNSASSQRHSSAPSYLTPADLLAASSTTLVRIFLTSRPSITRTRRLPPTAPATIFQSTP